MDFIPKELISAFNQQEMKITLINGSIISMVGSNSYDKIVGSNAKGIVVSEAALADPMGISYLKPIITASGGFFIMISTPRGHNHFYELFNTALASEDWHVSYLTVDDTKHITKEEIEADIADGILSYELAQQEYYCSWSRGHEGAPYNHYVQEMRENGQIGNVPHDPSLPVHIFMDLGYNDATALVFVQVQGPHLKVIDFYESNTNGLEHYVNVIKSKDYLLGQCFGPHDSKVHSLNDGVSRVDKLASLGLHIDVLDRVPIADSIEAVRTILPKTWIDEGKCGTLIKALENTVKEWDVFNNVYKPNKLVHGKYINAHDAFKYLAIGYKQIMTGDYTPEDLAKMRTEAQSSTLGRRSYGRR
jgi:hypothetical protein